MEKETLVGGEPNGGITESGNNNHEKETGRFESPYSQELQDFISNDKSKEYPLNKIKCISLDEKNVKRDLANEICYQAMENETMIKIPETYEEALKIFWKSCEVEHEQQKGKKYDKDELTFQPYSQRHIMPKIMERYWKSGFKCQIIYDPYNKHDIDGCDYMIFIGPHESMKIPNTQENYIVERVDQKSNLTILDPKNNGQFKDTKLFLKHINLKNGKKQKGFFLDETKKNNSFIFSLVNSNRVVNGELQSPEEIDETDNYFIPKDVFEEEIKMQCGYNGSYEDFAEDLYKNKCGLFQKFVTEFNKTGVVSDEMKKNGFEVIKNESTGKMVHGYMKIGNMFLRTSIKGNELGVYLSLNVRDTFARMNKNLFMHFSEEEGKNEFSKKSVENQTNT